MLYSAGMTDWQKEMTNRIGEHVQALRGKRTALWLSERTEQLGMKISRSAISELENGKRKSISIAEVFILAAALDVPPVLLVFPGYPDRAVDFLPGMETTSSQAANWVSGDQVLEFGEDGDTPELFGYSHSLVAAVSERDELMPRMMRTLPSETPGFDFHEYLEQMEREKVRLNRKIREAGGEVDDGSR